MTIALALAAGLASVVSAPRWLRVAQREHYIPGTVTLFWWRWWTSRPENVALLAIAVGGAVASFSWAAAGVVTAAIVVAGPIGLSLRGRTSPLRWTPRLQRLAATAGVIDAGATVVILAVGPVACMAVLALLVPLSIDLAAALLRPLERTLSEAFVRRARDRLREVSPTVVAITGSYGKTTTKEYVRHLVAGTKSVVATPASFNNRLGLARAINDHLTPGTDVFVAEMGTYGPGEIAEMVSWVPPDVSVFTALGPVHLERFRTLDRIATSKAEIVDGARAVVVNADEPLIVGAVAAVAEGVRVIRCSTSDPSADVHVLEGDGSLTIRAAGAELAAVDQDLFPMNVACAVAAALEVGVPRDVVARRLAGLPSPEHRRQVARSPRGVTVIDDTYNSNPRGAAAALDALGRVAGDGARRVVVTPGMVELGARQAEENRVFAARAAQEATDVVVVGRTNRRALLAGADGGPARVAVVDTREQAVAWVRSHLGPGDAVLYENDLPDHYP